MTTMLNSDVALRSGAAGALDGYAYDPAVEAQRYTARVVANGGTIGDPADLLAAITAAIGGGYYSAAACAVSPKWGRKVAGSTITKFYSLRGIDPVIHGTVTLQAGPPTIAYFDVIGRDYLTVPMTPLSRSGCFGMVSREVQANSASGGVMTFTSGSDFRFAVAQGRLDAGGRTVVPYIAQQNGAIGLFMNARESFAAIHEAGAALDTQSNFPGFAAGSPVEVTYTITGSNGLKLRELWLFDNPASDALLRATADLTARLP